MIAVHAALPACRAEVLDVRLGRGDGAAGTTYFPIVFTNSGPVACTLRGYPGVSSVSAQGALIGAPAAREAGAPVRTVTLRPRGSATAVFALTDAYNWPAARCHRTTARALRIYPPGETRSRILALRHLACGRRLVGSERVRAVTG